MREGQLEVLEPAVWMMGEKIKMARKKGDGGDSSKVDKVKLRLSSFTYLYFDILLEFNQE